MCKKVPGKITDKYNMENLKQASEEIWAQVPPKFFSTILRLVALVYKSFFFFSEQPFYRNYSTLASHTNTVISHAFAYYMPLVNWWRRKPWQGLFILLLVFSRMTSNFMCLTFSFLHSSSLWRIVTIFLLLEKAVERPRTTGRCSRNLAPVEAFR